MKYILAMLLCVAAHILTRSATAGVKIVCVGDSITYGHGVFKEDAYPGVLQRRLGSTYTVENLGICGTCVRTKGNNPYTGHTEIITATNGEPDIIVLMLGTNDGHPNEWANSSEFTNDFVAILDRLLAAPTQPRVFVCVPCPVMLSGDNFNIDSATVNNRVVPAVRSIAAARNIPLIDVNAHMTGHPEWFGEAVHPNLAGYKQIADVVYARIIGARITVEPMLDTSNRQTAIEFDATLPGTTSIRRFSIMNPGNEPLILTGSPALSFSGMDATDFTIMTRPESPIAPGGATTVDVCFSPTQYGDRDSTMTIRSSDAAQPVLTIPLHGRGSLTTYAMTNSITDSTNWHYHKGTSEASVPPEAWRTGACDVTGWPRGAMPFWYGDGKDGTLLRDMVGNYGTVYVQQDLIVGDPGLLTELILSVDYDDAFAVWVNGKLLRSVGAPEPQLHDSITTNNHECSVSPAVERGDIEVSRHPATAYLVHGTNIIAAMVFNRGLNSSDCHLNLNLSVVSRRVEP